MIFVRQVGWLNTSGWLGVLIVCLHCGCDRTAVAEEPSEAAGRPMRWAILGTPAIQDSGVSDLLHARLSSLEDIELVEREAFEAIAAEYSLAELEAAGGVRDRLQLGTVLRANRLLLLSRAAVKGDEQDGEAAEVFRLVIADCQTGARIGRGHFSAEAGPEDLIHAVVAAVGEAQSRFPDGVMRVVGVSHFLSKNLVHSYYHRQAGYAYLLQRALTLHPGTAVLEVEEARAIAQELSLGTPPDEADSLRRHPVPVLVDGEFTVSEDHASGTRSVALTVRIRRGDGVDEIRKAALPPAAVVSFLTGELARRVLALDDEQLPLLSPETQHDWLVARADKFRRVGAWEHSLGLREAALLLRPRDVVQRKALIHDYQRIMTRPLHGVPLEDQKPGNTNLARAVRERVDAYLAALSHLEHLIRQREVSHDEAVKRLGSLRAYNLLSAVRYQIFVVDGVYWRMGQESLVLAEEAEERFLTECYPEVIAMAPREENARRKFVNRWQKPLIETAFHRVDRTYRTREDLKFLERILTQVLPDGLEVPFALSQVYSLISHQPNVPLPDEAITQDDWDDFLQRLSKSEHRVAAIFARYCMIRERRERRSGSPAELRSLLAEVESLLQAYDALGDAGGSYSSRQREWMYGRIRDQRSSLKREVAPTSRPTPVRQAGERPTGWETTPEMWKQSGYPTTMGKLKFERIELKRKSRNGELQPLTSPRWRTYSGWESIANVTACGDRFDVWWNPGAVLVMREKGVLEEVAVDPQPIFTDVKWDGRHIWIGTRRAGLWVVDPQSLQVIVKIGEEAGLPPSNRTMMLHPADPGRVCVIGAFGEHSRAWCALVSWTGDAAHVKVFHEATHVPTGEIPRRESPAEPDVHLVFEPAWLHEYDSGEDRRYLLVGRDAPTLEGRSRPLLIDLDLLDVRSFGHTLAHANHRYSSSYYSREGQLLEASEFHIVHRPPPGETLPGGEDWRYLCTNVTRTGLIRKQILSFDGWLYVPGICWFRLHPDTFDEEMLVPGRLPNEYSMKRFSVSVHYGLLAWSNEAFLQVLIHDSSSTGGIDSPSK